ncbi:MAG TPA: class I SAM-dependent methyltransferase [Microvirga sp.]|jgi:ubiquinone/menaquinone biosynthesis C-methylase UbiE|nr:class I SAM-dependent methyltransferase [Microvirga sp.]
MTSLPETVTGLYERHARAFDRDRTKTLFERAWLDRFLTLVPQGGSMLDIGCGSGEPIARYVVGSGRRVTGVDSAPTLLALARERFPDEEWILADMRALDLDRRFDGVIAFDSFFHLAHDDQRRMFPRFARHAAPGAPLLFTSGPAHGEAIGAYGGEPLYHASLAPEEYRALLAENGFAVAGHRVEDPDCGGRTLWLAQRGT